MEKLPPYWIKLIPVIFWIPLLAVVLSHRLGDGLGWVNAWNDSMLWVAKKTFPSDDPNSTWGGLTFISVCTGLNLAMVKFELFRKTYKDLKEVWNQHILDQLTGGGLVASALDDDAGLKLKKSIESECNKHLDSAYEAHWKRGLAYRSLAIQCCVLGFLALFMQWSGGIFSLVLLFPVLGQWITKCSCAKALERAVEIIMPFGRELLADLQTKKEERKDEIKEAVVGQQGPPSPFQSRIIIP